MKHFYVLCSLVFCAASAVAQEAPKGCACNQSAAQALVKKPSASKTAFIGTVEREGADRLVRVTHTWSPYRATYKAPQGSSCALMMERGKRYLVLSSMTVDQIDKNKLNLTACDSVAFRLGVGSETAISQLAEHKVDDYTAPNPAWLSCVKSEDCVDARGVCGNTTGINSKYRTQFDDWARAVAPRVECSSIDESAPDKITFKCVEGLCSL